MIEWRDLEQSGYVLALFEAMWRITGPKPKKKSKETRHGQLVEAGQDRSQLV